MQLEAAPLQGVLRGCGRRLWERQHRGHGMRPARRPEVQRPQRAELLRGTQLRGRHLQDIGPKLQRR